MNRLKPGWLIGFWGLALLAAGTTPTAWGEVSARILEFSLDARAAALGSKGVALPGQLTAWRGNPAVLATLPALCLGASFRNEFEDVQSGALDFGLALPLGALGAEIFSLSSGSLPEAGVVAEMDWLLSLGYALDMAAWIKSPYALNLGLSLKYFRSTLAGEYTGQTALSDLGILAQLPWPGFYLALVLQNAGLPIQYDSQAEDLPIGAMAGISWLGGISPDFGMLIDLEVQESRDAPLVFQGGGELNYQQRLFLRGGYRTPHDTDAFSAGLGVKLPPFTLDYAIVFNQLSLKHLTTLTLAFPAPAKGAGKKPPAVGVDQSLSYYRAGRFPEAKASLQQTLTQEPDNAYAQRYLNEFEYLTAEWCEQKNLEAQAAEQRADYPKAQGLWDQVLKADPQNRRALAGRARLNQLAQTRLDIARQAVGRKQWPAALIAIQAVLEVVPDSVQALATQTAVKEQIAAAVGEKERLAAMIAVQARSMARAGKLEEALTLVKKAMSVNPQNPELDQLREQILQETYNFAKELEAKNQIQRALRLWQRILSLAPDYAPAKSAYQQLFQVYQDKIRDLSHQAQLAYASLRYTDAIVLWEKLYKIAPEPETASLLADANEAQGILEYREDHLPEALAFWEAALRADPGRQNLNKYILRAKNKKKFFQNLKEEGNP